MVHLVGLVLICFNVFISKGQHLIVSDSLKQGLFRIDTETQIVQMYNFTDILNPIALDIDIQAGVFFWTDVGNCKIFRAGVDGTDQVLIKSLPRNSVPDGLAVDSTIKKVFYTDTGRKVISSMDYDGNSENNIIYLGLDQPRAIVLDTNNKKMYWTDWGTQANIMGADYDGGSKMEIVTTTIAWPNGLVLDQNEQMLYWCDAKLERIEAIRTNGADRRLLALELSAHYFGLAIVGEYLYITDWSIKNLKRIHKSGGAIETFGPSMFSRLNGICVQHKNISAEVYLSTKVAKQLTPSKSAASKLIVADSAKHDLFSIDLETQEVERFNFIGLMNPIAVGIDVDDQFLFWTDVVTHKLYRADLDGKNQIIIKSLSLESVPDGLAVDTNLKIIFYTDTGLDVIKSLGYDGTNEMTIVNVGIHEPRAIVLDMQKRIMFWTDWGQDPNIMKASYNGENKIKLVSELVQWPNGLAFDEKAQTLYWCDGGLKRVESIRADGTDRRLLAMETSAHYFGLTLAGEYLYITDWSISNLKRIHKTGGAISKFGPEVFSKLCGIILQSQMFNIVSSKRTLQTTSTTIQFASSIYPIISTSTQTTLNNKPFNLTTSQTTSSIKPIKFTTTKATSSINPIPSTTSQTTSNIKPLTTTTSQTTLSFYPITLPTSQSSPNIKPSTKTTSNIKPINLTTSQTTPNIKSINKTTSSSSIKLVYSTSTHSTKNFTISNTNKPTILNGQLLLVLIIVVGIVLITLIITVGIVCWRWQIRKSKATSHDLSRMLEMENPITNEYLTLNNSCSSATDMEMEYQLNDLKKQDSNPTYVEIDALL